MKTQNGLIAAAVTLMLFMNINCQKTRQDTHPYLDAAQKSFRWIKSTEISGDLGERWPRIPGEVIQANGSIYHGTAGIVLSFLEAYMITGDESFLVEAKKGADTLLNIIPEGKFRHGLFFGMGGIGFVLDQAYEITGAQKYRDRFIQILNIIQGEAVEVGSGIQWSDTTDVTYGAAGTGLILIYAAHRLGDGKLLELAARAGDRLIERGIPDHGGLKWPMDSEFPRLMPNFSHGTAGNSYFLARLYEETRNKKYLDAALAGTRYLLAIADTTEDKCLIHHDETEGKDIYYLGWCHGPVGTTRLFYKLFQITGEQSWMDWVEKGARGILQSGIPEKETPGFWKNVGQCCGNAGVAEYFLSLYRITEKEKYLVFARKIADDVLAKAVQDKSGMRWPSVESRKKPDIVKIQTGFMQGAAGIGAMFLHLYGQEIGKGPYIVLPGNPFEEGQDFPKSDSHIEQ